jgi:hypothetical protein
MESLLTLITTIGGKVIFWVAVEAFLNLAGLDNLADYSEYIFEREWGNEAAIVALNYSLGSDFGGF